MRNTEVDELLRCMKEGLPLSDNLELRRLAQEAVERMKHDTRTDDEKLKDMVNFVLYGPGGD